MGATVKPSRLQPIVRHNSPDTFGKLPSFSVPCPACVQMLGESCSMCLGKRRISARRAAEIGGVVAHDGTQSSG